MAAESRGGLYTLSENSNVRLGLMLVLIGSVAYLIRSQYEIKDEVTNRMNAQTAQLSIAFVSKDVFEAKMTTLLEGQRYTQEQLRDLRDEVKELRKVRDAR